MADASKYGKSFWHITLPDSGVMLYADRMEVAPDGSLLFFGKYQYAVDHDVIREVESKESIMFALAPGQWKRVWAASIIDGSAVSVDSWKSTEKGE